MGKVVIVLFTAISSFFICSSQNECIIIDKKELTDFTASPIFLKIADTSGEEYSWKPGYTYLDSIIIFHITYLSDGFKVKGFLVRPKMPGKYPCIIYNRGGNRDFGSLKISHAALLMGKLARNGYILIASQYRGNAGGEGKEEFGGAELNDVLILMDALSEIEHADTSRIGMFGWSRGGMMTYLAMRETRRLKAAVVGGALSDQFALIDDRPVMESGVLAELVPDYSQVKSEALTDRSAILWANKLCETTPLLILHGNSDWRVKADQSYRMAMELDRLRHPHRLIIYEGGDHGLTGHRKSVDLEVLAWFNRFLKNNEALPNMEYHGR